MKRITRDFLKNNLVNHPYESNPDYFARITFLYFSPDEKVISFYWEAPEGSFDFEFSGYDEVLYLIEGELDLLSEKEILTLKKGELYSARDGDRIQFRIKKSIKSFAFMYPATREVLEGIKKMIKNVK